MSWSGSSPRVKVCCIASVEEAQLAVRCGAAAIGLVGRMPSGPGVIDEATIAEIAAAVPPPVATFLLTSEVDAEAVIAQHRRCRTSAIQLTDDLARGGYEDLRRALPGVKLVQVIHVRGEASIEEARRAGAGADALLLDSGDPTRKVKELGGTGRVHDWEVSRRIVRSVGVPVFLAGGLHAGNVRDAVQRVEPFGLDVCTGVRRGGRLDPMKLRDFFESVPSAMPPTTAGRGI